MAATRLSKLLRKYKLKEKELKDEYKKKNNLARAVGFSKSKAKKNNDRNRKRALKNYYKNKIEKLQRKKERIALRSADTEMVDTDSASSEDKKLLPTNLTNKVKILTAEPFWSAFYFGSTLDSLVSDIYDTANINGNLAAVEVDATLVGHGISLHKNRSSFDRRIRSLYQLLSGDTQRNNKSLRKKKKGKKNSEGKQKVDVMYYLVDAYSYNIDKSAYVDITVYDADSIKGINKYDRHAE